MSGIARVLAERGETVTGSDQAPSSYARALESIGVPIAYGHAAQNVAGADLVLVSSAVPAANPELVAAREAGLPVVRREAFLGELTRGSRVMAVAGTHGKSTTTGWVAWLLSEAGMDPSFIAGGLLLDFGTNAHAGEGKAFVIEADEYDHAFLGLSPEVGVITNVEHDHPDCYPTPEDFRTAFQAFAERIERQMIVCVDDPGAASLSGPAERVTYGLDPKADWRAEEIRPNSAGGSDFLALQSGVLLGLVRTRLPGLHNVRNALASLAMSEAAGVPFATARQAMSGYRGVSRRSEIVGESGDVLVVDDYAHHPTEVKATLAALRQRYPSKTLWAVFQPHTFSRIRALMPGFAEAFADADQVLVTDIFAAREQPDGVVTGQRLVATLDHPAARFTGSLEDTARCLMDEVKPGSVVVTLSAGDGNRVGQMLLEELRLREGGQHE